MNAARPATLVAFSDAHDGKLMPETHREIAWVVHHALDVAEPLDVWLDSLEDVSAIDEDVKLAKRIIAGDEEAREVALGLRERPAEEEDAEASDPPLEEVSAAGGG